MESLVILCPGWVLLCSLSHETNLPHSFRVIISRAGDVGGELSESVVAWVPVTVALLLLFIDLGSLPIVCPAGLSSMSAFSVRICFSSSMFQAGLDGR